MSQNNLSCLSIAFCLCASMLYFKVMDPLKLVKQLYI